VSATNQKPKTSFGVWWIIDVSVVTEVKILVSFVFVGLHFLWQ
jgi:hypothetical protein